MVTIDEKQAFSTRLNLVLDAEGMPPKGSGRQIKLADDWSLSQKGVRKWLEGESIPETTRLIEMAKRYRVSFEWLATGRHPSTLQDCAEIVRGTQVVGISETSDPSFDRLLEAVRGKSADEIARIGDALNVLLAGGKTSGGRIAAMAAAQEADDLARQALERSRSIDDSNDALQAAADSKVSALHPKGKRANKS